MRRRLRGNAYNHGFERRFMRNGGYFHLTEEAYFLYYRFLALHHHHRQNLDLHPPELPLHIPFASTDG
jgi:hypothetical protein